ncbi:MAG: hypothetical protein AB7R55_16255 [Gemmatimonadales bacterium]
MIELEVKAVVVDPAALLTRLETLEAEPGFRGMMRDRRYDRGTTLRERDEVLRTRAYEGTGGRRVHVSWKGPVSVEAGGYKRRPELEYRVSEGPVDDVFVALGYGVVEAIDRFVAYYRLRGATVRVEWYPRMDCLLEVEGEPAEIESAIGALELPRAAFSAEALPEFVIRYEARTGRRAVVSEAGLGGDPPSWAGVA